MQHGRKGPLPGFLIEDRRHVVIGIARMNDERQPGLARGGDMIAEAARLRLDRAEIVMAVKPGLADRHRLGLARARHQIGDREIELLMGVMGMRPDRAKDIRKAFHDGKKPGLPHDPRGDGDDAADAGRLGPPHDGVEIAGEILEIEMAMAVNHCRSGRQALIF